VTTKEQFEDYLNSRRNSFGVVTGLLRRVLEQQYNLSPEQIDSKLAELESANDSCHTEGESLDIFNMLLSVEELHRLTECALKTDCSEMFDHVRAMSERIYQTGMSMFRFHFETVSKIKKHSDSFKQGSTNQKYGPVREEIRRRIFEFMSEHHWLPSPAETWKRIMPGGLIQGIQDGRIEFTRKDKSEGSISYKTFSNLHRDEIKTLFLVKPPPIPDTD